MSITPWVPVIGGPLDGMAAGWTTDVHVEKGHAYERVYRRPRFLRSSYFYRYVGSTTNA